MFRLALIAFIVIATASGADTAPVPLSNGKDLEGWQIDTPGVWSVRDGMIVGGHNGLGYNDFLRTKRVYKNFVLHVKFRLVDGKGNSGVQFRSKPVPDSHEVSGYQADIADRYWGCLYDESRRNRVLAQASAQALAVLNKTGWNEYVIRAEGKHITLELNGTQAVDYVEQDAAVDESGFIALQVHASKDPIEVQFKDIRIQVLD